MRSCWRWRSLGNARCADDSLAAHNCTTIVPRDQLHFVLLLWYSFILIISSHQWSSLCTIVSVTFFGTPCLSIKDCFVLLWDIGFWSQHIQPKPWVVIYTLLSWKTSMQLYILFLCLLCWHQLAQVFQLLIEEWFKVNSHPHARRPMYGFKDSMILIWAATA